MQKIIKNRKTIHDQCTNKQKIIRQKYCKVTIYEKDYQTVLTQNISYSINHRQNEEECVRSLKPRWMAFFSHTDN